MASERYIYQERYEPDEAVIIIPNSYSIKQYIYAKKNELYMLFKTIQSEDDDLKDIDKLAFGIWRENCIMPVIVALVKLIIRYFYYANYDNIDEIINYHSISLMPIIRSVQHVGNNEFESHIKFKYELQNDKIYEYAFRINHKDRQLIIGLVANDKYFGQNWWATCDMGLGLDVHSGFFVTYIGTTELLSQLQYMECPERENMIIRIRINRTNQTVRYFHNQLDLGIGFHLEKNSTYNIAATLTGIHQEIRLIDSKELKMDPAELTVRDKCILKLPTFTQRLEHQFKESPCKCLEIHLSDIV